MFDTARESSLSQAVSNINAYLLNANTDKKAAKNIKFLTFLRLLLIQINRYAYLSALNTISVLLPLIHKSEANPE